MHRQFFSNPLLDHVRDRAARSCRLLGICLLALVVTGRGRPVLAAGVDRPAERVQTSNSPNLEAQLASERRARETSIPGEQKLDTRPVGAHVFRMTAELEDPDVIKPGSSVDVQLASLGEEGPESVPILRSVKVYSIGSVRRAEAESLEVSDESDTASDPNDRPEENVYSLGVVGLIVNGRQLETLRLAEAQGMVRLKPAPGAIPSGAFGQVLHNFTSNLFQPLLLFFFLGFAVPLLKVPFEFPPVLYQSLTIYLLLAIGWHGGELMAQQSSSELAIAGGLVVIGFVLNGLIGLSASASLRWLTPMRRIDAVTVGAYYGSDSAGTFVTCLGILAVLNILHDSYMPVLLASMEIPGCLVGLFLVARLREQGMDTQGNMPGEPGYSAESRRKPQAAVGDEPAGESGRTDPGSGATQVAVAPARIATSIRPTAKKGRVLDWKIAHEVFLNPGLFLLFGGILVGFISGLQALEDPSVVEGPNHLFVFIFKGALCLFLLEMGMTACRQLRDLKSAGWGFIAFGLLAPNLFAIAGMLSLHAYSIALNHPFYLGTYALFAVLCAAASYIAVPAVQRLAIPEASPTLPLAASLGLTFTWNVTLGIPIYIEIGRAIVTAMPVT